MSNKAMRILLVIGLAIFIFAVTRVLATSRETGKTTPASPSQAVLGLRTKASDCKARGALPDPECTPGATISSATASRICVKGYASSVRNVPASVKSKVYREYEVTSHPRGAYEVDHLISLELGGSNDIANLWPEAADPTPGFHEKDVVENYLHDQVCSGRMSLSTAQQQIAGNWLNVYHTIR